MKSKDTGPSSAIIKRPKRSKHDSLSAKAVPTSENIIIDDPAEKPKKEKAKDPEHSQQQCDTSQKNRKKRKNRDAEEQEESMEHKARSEEGAEPPKKKHKNRTSFSDPREDTELNTQSRKALEYVFTQMNRPSRWKFNKARQNWLIRNIWSPETVPDIYFPLVLKYLSNVQGGSREKLKESCQTYLTAEVTPVEAISTPLAEADTTKPAKPTPGPLITPSSQPTPGAIVPTVGTISTLVSDAATVLASTKRTRAQSLLDVLI